MALAMALGLVLGVPHFRESATPSLAPKTNEAPAQPQPQPQPQQAPSEYAHSTRSFPCAPLLRQGPWNHAFYLLLDAALPPTPVTLTSP